MAHSACRSSQLAFTPISTFLQKRISQTSLRRHPLSTTHTRKPVNQNLPTLPKPMSRLAEHPRATQSLSIPWRPISSLIQHHQKVRRIRLMSSSKLTAHRRRAIRRDQGRTEQFLGFSQSEDEGCPTVGKRGHCEFESEP